MYNERLYSREGAAELLGISVSTLADYELGNTKVVPVDKVVLMADLYNAPELKTGYCKHECPICSQFRRCKGCTPSAYRNTEDPKSLPIPF